jgi:type VI protein secretion system component VasA
VIYFFSEESFPQPQVTKYIKDKEHKKKKLKSSSTKVVTAAPTTTTESENVARHLSVDVTGATTTLPGTIAEGTEITEAGSETSAVNHVAVVLRPAGTLPTSTFCPENEAQQIAPVTCMKPLRKSEGLEAGEGY